MGNCGTSNWKVMHKCLLDQRTDTSGRVQRVNNVLRRTDGRPQLTGVQEMVPRLDVIVFNITSSNRLLPMQLSHSSIRTAKC